MKNEKKRSVINPSTLPRDILGGAVIKGIIGITSTGTGYVTSAGFSADIKIEPQFLNTALHGDEVEFSVFPQIDEEKLSGEVIKVSKRAKMEFVGTIDKRKGSAFSFVIPDDKRMYMDIFISPASAPPSPKWLREPSNASTVTKALANKPAGKPALTRQLQNGYKVLVQIIKWDDPKKNPEGKILKVLGKKGDNDVEMESIVLEKGFQMGFPPKVEKEAETLGKKSKPIPQEDVTGRRDFRDSATFTIDPEDAKDFDDAISFESISDDVFEVGVHIADVAHYVREGGKINEEARHRGVSVYLVDRTIPMLPEILSNDICSLNPNQDKLTFSAVLTISTDGHIKKVWLGRTVINSNKRFTYEEAQKTLDEKKGEYHYELNYLNTLARILRDGRMKMGALDFAKEEVKFKLDAKGKPVSIVEKPILDAHKIVEEFMILANKEVASYLSGEIKKINKGASVYRIHDAPKKEAMDELLFFLRMLGHEIEAKGQHISSKELNEIFEKIKGRPEESLVKTAAMRSMSKAIYSITNIGHYGLALEHYTHFTSPIRRYADILVHRILEKHLKGGSLSDQEIAWHHSFAAALSQREVDAADAERSSVAYKQVEYMMDKIGNVYEGVISGITKWGVYVEESRTKANGMVKFKDMKDDFYVFNKETYSLVGTKSKRKYSVGDEVKIKIIGGDLEKRVLDYIFV